MYSSVNVDKPLCDAPLHFEIAVCVSGKLAPDIIYGNEFSKQESFLSECSLISANNI